MEQATGLKQVRHDQGKKLQLGALLGFPGFQFLSEAKFWAKVEKIRNEKRQKCSTPKSLSFHIWGKFNKIDLVSTSQEIWISLLNWFSILSKVPRKN